MVIKDVLQKLNSSDPNDPKVKALREKLAKLKSKQSENQEPSSNSKQSESKQKPANVPKVKLSAEKQEMKNLQEASEDEQRKFAQEERPQLRVKEERTQKLVTKQVGELIELITEMEKKIKKLEQEKSQTKQHIERLEKHNKDLNEKMEIIDGRLEKFMSLYEIITNKYNPFSEKETETPKKHSSPPISNKVKLSDELTGQQEAVEFQQGQISSENKQKIDQLLQELEQDEEGESKLELGEQDEVQERQHELADELKQELHTLFNSYEQRMSAHVDETVRSQVHEILGGLEEALDTEVEEAVEERVEELREDEDIIESAFKELQALEQGSQKPDEFEKEEHAIEEELRNIDTQIRAIPSSLYFRLHDGRILKSADDLHDALKDITQQVFRHHVNNAHNDFADWMELALNDPRGPKLRNKSREEMVAIFEN